LAVPKSMAMSWAKNRESRCIMKVTNNYKGVTRYIPCFSRIEQVVCDASSWMEKFRAK